MNLDTTLRIFDVSVLGLAIEVSLAVMLLSVVLAAVRVVRGPSLPDRVVALDLVGVLSVGVIGLVALRSGIPVFLDASLALALVAFLGTVAYGRYVEKSGDENGEDKR